MAISRIEISQIIAIDNATPKVALSAINVLTSWLIKPNAVNVLTIPKNIRDAGRKNPMKKDLSKCLGSALNMIV
jgi:hypothetical protein